MTHDRDVPYELLPALSALIGRRSVTAAAKQLGVTQPAMSRTLQRLRTILNDQILVRSGQTWMLTPRAEAMIEPLENVARIVQRMVAEDRFEAITAAREFRVVIPDVIAAPLLPRLYEALKLAAPSCSLTVLPWRGPETAKESFDLAITTEIALFPSHRIDKLYSDRDVLAYRASDELRANDIFSRPHVAVIPAGHSRDIVDIWLDEQSIQRPVGLVVPTYLQALHAVSASPLLGILPMRLVAKCGAQLAVSFVELPIEQVSDSYWLVCPANLYEDAGVRWLRREIALAAR
jgi:DNA-binding transcriptional LysR family regulator